MQPAKSVDIAAAIQMHGITAAQPPAKAGKPGKAAASADAWEADLLKQSHGDPTLNGQMAALLKKADFARTLHTFVLPEGRVRAFWGNLADAGIRRKMLHERWNYFGPTCAGHTLKAYRRLPYGWRPRPDGMYSDLYMWRQWLKQPWCRFKSENVATTLHFPSPLRQGWTLEKRCAELDYWTPRLGEAKLRQWLALQVLQD